jgi:hypothetical protein
MEWTFTGEVIEWRGPAPYLFVAMAPEESEDLKEAARGLVYWGQVPVHVTIGGTEFATALFPRDGHYLVPARDPSTDEPGPRPLTSPALAAEEDAQGRPHAQFCPNDPPVRAMSSGGSHRR